ncbi:hypothetical protein VNI00_017788 [Paramarasmius palmivorus]|uniref:Zn(2)-C6 fungal-type domain-containing protein n=1 Tax=Paramarasmius palmivorus TaxID=297713 RepID=A0AAW0B4C5_9AGAR
MFNSGKHFQIHGHAIHHVDGISININLNNTPQTTVRCVHDPQTDDGFNPDSDTDVDGLEAEDMHWHSGSSTSNISTSNARERDQRHRYLDAGHTHRVAHQHHHRNTQTKVPPSIYPKNPHSHSNLKIPGPPPPRHSTDPILAAILRDLQTGRLTGDVIGHIHGVGLWCVITGRLPFHDLSNDGAVITAIIRGKHPLAPLFVHKAPYDAIWSLITYCWNPPDSRPQACNIVESLAELLQAAGTTIIIAEEWDSQLFVEMQNSVDRHCTSEQVVEFLSAAELKCVPKELGPPPTSSRLQAPRGPNHIPSTSSFTNYFGINPTSSRGIENARRDAGIRVTEAKMTTGAPKAKGAVRAKSACYTCRIRRKKCDEKPDEQGRCETCVRLRLQCLGFGAKRPDWFRKSDIVSDIRDKIKTFLASQEDHSGSSSQTSQNPTQGTSPELAILMLADEGCSSSASEED